ncbi:LysR family transcriptional regulator [Leifsonia sp. NPDC058292]|uniref:LysR family transcriptional regulator n=1 Tax=Leifsonia sp. NPDC058292 TaxID=3346428 RepID=UPI0036D76F33
MEVNQLRVMDAVARTGSITAAAEELHYAQASVSHHLARLQEHVGAALTARRGRGIVLTPEGELLAVRAREILRRLDETESEVTALSRQLRSRLRIAAFQSALLELVPPALQQLQGTYQDIALELRESHPIDALDLVRRNEVDVALMHRPDDAPVGDEFAAVKLYNDPVYLLSTTPNDSVANHRDSSWIAGCDRCQAGIEAVCLAEGFQPRISLRTEDINIQASFVAAGLGVITMPGTALRSLDMRRLSASPLPNARRRVWAVTRRSAGAGIARDFIDAVATATAGRDGSRPS